MKLLNYGTKIQYVFGSFLYFKLLKIKIKSDEGLKLAKNQGGVYDKYIIPFEKKNREIHYLSFWIESNSCFKTKMIFNFQLY